MVMSDRVAAAAAAAELSREEPALMASKLPEQKGT